MKRIKIEANKYLFDEIKEILNFMKSSLPSIVQNDMEVDLEEYKEWSKTFDSYIEDIKKWKENVHKHIIGCNK